MTRGTVVLVHGLWNPSWVMALLALRLRRAGFATRLFAYRSVRGHLAEHAARLAQCLAREPATPPLYLVGFSLGGLVVRAYLHDHGGARVARVVMLGTPNQGSAIASRLSRFAWARAVMGHGIRELLAGLPDQGRWRGPPLGLIAGHYRRRAHHDRLVWEHEVWLAGASACATVRADHAGLLWSRAAATLTTRFLTDGHF